MLGKSPVQGQKDLFRPLLLDFIDLKHELVLLSEKIQWKELEKDFSVLFSHTGTPSKPIRLMSGLLILKQMYNLSDEGLIASWISNPYMQYFCGEACFQWQQPCDPSELVHFRKRIGVEGVEKILKQSVNLFSAELEKAEELIVDTTVQEKNITFPTDVKLQLKIAAKCNAIAEKEGITLRQSYSRTLKELKLKLRLSYHPARRKEANKARRKIKTIAGRLVRDVSRKLNQEQLSLYHEQLDIFRRVLLQRKESKDKIYSLHATEVACIAKGKPHKPYEFGCKVGIAMAKGLNIIAGVASFTGNPHDSQTLEPTLKHVKEITGKAFKAAIVDRGYRGKKKVGETEVILPGAKEDQKLSRYKKNKKRKQCKARAAIEPIISHIKHDCRMIRNYLKGVVGDKINAMMAAAAFNFRQWINKTKAELSFLCFFLFCQIFYFTKNINPKVEIQTS